jgi:hypothetical protein
MEDAARSFQTSVDREVGSTEAELNRLAQDTQSAVDGFGGAEPAAAQPEAPADPGQPASEAKPQPPEKKPA